MFSQPATNATHTYRPAPVNRGLLIAVGGLVAVITLRSVVDLLSGSADTDLHPIVWLFMLAFTGGYCYVVLALVAVKVHYDGVQTLSWQTCFKTHHMFVSEIETIGPRFLFVKVAGSEGVIWLLPCRGIEPFLKRIARAHPAQMPVRLGFIGAMGERLGFVGTCCADYSCTGTPGPK